MPCEEDCRTAGFGRLELSIEKTQVVELTEGFQFLGHRLRYKWHPRFGYMPRLEIPKGKRADFRYLVKQHTKRATTHWSLSRLLQKLNPILRGWGNYYRFCTGAGRQFAILDYYVEDRIWRWLMKKHQSLPRKRTRLVRLPSLLRPTRKVWREGRLSSFFSPRSVWSAFAADGCAHLPTLVFPESRMHNERCTSGSEGGHQKPTAVNAARR